MTRVVGSVVVWAMVAGWASAQEAYTIRPTKAGPGTTLLAERKTTQGKRLLVQDPGGKVLDNKEQSFTDTVTCRESVLAQAPGWPAPTHLVKVFVKAQRQSGDRMLTLPFEGKTYDIEWRDGRYQFRSGTGEPLLAEALAPLEGEYNGPGKALDWEKSMLPAGPVRVNDVWRFDLGQILGAIGKDSAMQFDTARATATARLSQVYQHENHSFAVVDADVELPATAVAQPRGVQPLQSGSGLRLRLRLNYCIDGSAEALAVDLNMEIKTIVRAPGPRNSMVWVQQTQFMHLNETRRELPRQ
jgi:hypothetical protein